MAVVKNTTPLWQKPVHATWGNKLTFNPFAYPKIPDRRHNK